MVLLFFAHQNQEPGRPTASRSFHKTVLNEFYCIAFRKRVYRAIDKLQADLDVWIVNTMRRGPIWCFGKTPMHTLS